MHDCMWCMSMAAGGAVHGLQAVREHAAGHTVHDCRHCMGRSIHIHHSCESARGLCKPVALDMQHQWLPCACRCLRQVSVLSRLLSVCIALGDDCVLPAILDGLHNAARLRFLRVVGGDDLPGIKTLPRSLEHLSLISAQTLHPRPSNFYDGSLGRSSFTHQTHEILPVVFDK